MSNLRNTTVNPTKAANADPTTQAKWKLANASEKLYLSKENFKILVKNGFIIIILSAAMRLMKCYHLIKVDHLDLALGLALGLIIRV